MEQPCFHLSIPAIDLELSRHWYEQVLGCRAGRSSDEALILDLGGHQLVLQRHPDEPGPTQLGIYPRHFGLIFQDAAPWLALQERIKQTGQPFAVGPKVRFEGGVLEHRTFFLQDPSQNWLEFKHYRHREAVLGCQEQHVVGDHDLRQPMVRTARP